MTLPLPPISLLAGAALFLDFDGTLVDFADRPNAIVVDDSLRALLQALTRKLNGRVAVISGRSLEDLAGHLAIDGLPIVGSHGLETRDSNGAVSQCERPRSLDAVIGAVTGFARLRDLVVEPKPAGIALHFRNRPRDQAAATEFVERLAARHEMTVQRGAMVVELRANGPDKGSIVRQFMAQSPFTSGTPVVMGDDLTDEHAFAAAIDMGGTGILVGDTRPTMAQFRLASVPGARLWLASGL